MHSKEKLYHIANVAAVPTAALSAFLLVSMGRLADEGQISMSSPGMSLASLLLFTVAGVCVLWIAASSLIHVRMKAGVRKNGNGLINGQHASEHERYNHAKSHQVYTEPFCDEENNGDCQDAQNHPHI